MAAVRVEAQKYRVASIETAFANSSNSHLSDFRHFDVQEGVAAKLLFDRDHPFPVTAIVGVRDMLRPDT